MTQKDKIRLEQLDKKLPFSVPENYFENFAESLQSQLTPKVAPSVPLYRKLRPYLFAAAIFVGVLLVGVPIYQRTQTKTVTVSVATSDVYSDYVLSEVDEDMMIDYLIDSDIN